MNEPVDDKLNKIKIGDKFQCVDTLGMTQAIFKYIGMGRRAYSNDGENYYTRETEEPYYCFERKNAISLLFALQYFMD